MNDIQTIVKFFQSQLHAVHTIDADTNYFKVSKLNYFKAAEHLRKQGFNRLLTVSAVDWIDKNNFETYFIVHSLTENTYVKVAAEIPRDEPTIPSLTKLWPNAAMHEREAWELFKITFEGNSILEPLFLEDTVEIPPFRKDYNWREQFKKS